MLNNIYRGNTVAFTALPKVNGTTVDALHGSVRFMLKTDRADPDSKALLVKESLDGTFELSASETNALDAGRIWYEFRWCFNDAVYTLEIGNVTVVDTVFD